MYLKNNNNVIGVKSYRIERKKKLSRKTQEKFRSIPILIK